MNENKCKAITKKGERCKNKIKESSYCHIHYKIRNNNIKSPKKCYIKFIPNEIIASIYKQLDLQSQIYLSRTNKYLHNIFKYSINEVNMEDVMTYIVRNRYKRKNNNFESIFYLFIYHIKKKGFVVKGNFDIYLDSYDIFVFIDSNNLLIKHDPGGIFVSFNHKRLCYIDDKLCVFNDILILIDNIFYLKDKIYEINDLFNNIKKHVKNLIPKPPWKYIDYKSNILYNKDKEEKK
jgi:hypothetical protein